MDNQHEYRANKNSSKVSTTVITFVSGKGGVGKTSLSLSLAKLLAETKSKVLLIDFDLATHGATHFFQDEIRSYGLNEGIVEGISSNESQAARSKILDGEELFDPVMFYNKRLRPVEIKDNFFFLPSKVDFQTRSLYPQSEFDDELEYVLSGVITSYDFVIIDAQAGVVSSALLATERSDKVIIVTEPDPICVSTAKNLEYEFRGKFPKDTFWVLNKILLTEAKEYGTIENYLTIFEHLPPVPFDFEVRKAFARRRIPIDLDDPSAFFFGVSRLAKALLPNLRSRLQEVEANVKYETSRPIQAKIEEIDSKLSAVRYSMSKQSRKKRIVLLISAVSALYFITGGFMLLTRFFKIDLQSPTELTAVIMSATGLLGISIAFILYFQTTILSGSDRLEKELDLLRAERDKYDTLLVTRSDELIMTPEDLKENVSHSLYPEYGGPQTDQVDGKIKIIDEPNEGDKGDTGP